MKEKLFTSIPHNTESFKMVHDGADVKIYEGGWWIKRSDYDAMWYDYSTGRQRKYPRSDIGMSRDEETKQIKIFIIPTPSPRTDI